MAAVLMFNLSKKKRDLLQILSVRLNFVCRDICPECQFCLISDLLAGKQKHLNSAKSFRDEMLIMDGFLHDDLNFLLNELIRTENPIALKAVSTPTNVKWTAFMLHSQLTAEQRLMKFPTGKENI